MLNIMIKLIVIIVKRNITQSVVRQKQYQSSHSLAHIPEPAFGEPMYARP